MFYLIRSNRANTCNLCLSALIFREILYIQLNEIPYIILLFYKNLIETYNFQLLIINWFLPSLLYILFHNLYKISNNTLARKKKEKKKKEIYRSSILHFSFFPFKRRQTVVLFIRPKKIIALYSPVSPVSYNKKNGTRGWKFRNPIHNLSSAKKHLSLFNPLPLSPFYRCSNDSFYSIDICIPCYIRYHLQYLEQHADNYECSCTSWLVNNIRLRPEMSEYLKFRRYIQAPVPPCFRIYVSALWEGHLFSIL